MSVRRTSDAPLSPEMRRRSEGAVRTRIEDTPLARPALGVSAESLRAHFEGPVGQAQARLPNPHLEPRVSADDEAAASAASVLLGVVLREPEPTVLLTQRHHGISHPGHWVFPGGRGEASDATPQVTALREAEEEIGLDTRHIEVLGNLGDYVSHSGFRISPVVALVHPPIELTPQPGEVDAIAEVALSRLVDPAGYYLYRFRERRDRAHFTLDTGVGQIWLTGVTVALAIGLYSELLKTHAH